jgi:hypothetical protein
MNFTFRILALDYTCRRCKLYTIAKEGYEFSEAIKFIINERNKNSEDFERLKVRLENIKNRHGARIEFFKSEGTESDLVHALHAGSKKQGYLQLNHLRWYCIRLSDRCVILGNGGVKHVAKTQDDSFLMEKERDMRWVDYCLSIASEKGDITTDDDGFLVGDLHFTKQRLEDYGLQ